MISCGIVSNQGTFLKEAIESVLGQLPRFNRKFNEPEQLILINDASTDALLVMREYETLQSVKIISHETKIGHIHGYNEMIVECTQPYFHLMAADDRLNNPNFYQIALDFLEDPDIGFVAGGLEWIDENDKDLRFKVIPPFEYVTESRNVLEAMKWCGNFICGGCVVIRSEIQKRLKYEERFPFSADWLNWIRVLKMCKKVCFIPAAIYQYRRHSSQMTYHHSASDLEREEIRKELRERIY